MSARDSQLESPILDGRSFQDLVNEAKGRIQQRCPTWTDHNVSDPGIILVELYAYMTDMLLYRLNQTPNRSYLSFLKLIGAVLDIATPATGEVIFSLDSLDAPLAAGETIRIPAGTEIGTTPDVDSERVFYSTDSDDAIEATRPVAFLTGSTGSDLDHGKSETSDFLGGKPVVIWSPDGAVSRFAIGFQNNLSRHRIEVSLTPHPPDSTGKTAPTLSWQYFSKSDQADGQDSAWKDLPAQPDDSSAPTPGRFLLQLPDDCGESTLQGTMAGTWIQGVAGFLRLMSWGDGSGVPTSGNNLVIVGIDSNGLLHIRIFDAAGVLTDTFEKKDSSGALHLETADASGTVLSDKLESSLPQTQTDVIKILKQELPGLLPRRDVLTDAEKAQVIGAATSIVGQTLAAWVAKVEVRTWGLSVPVTEGRMTTDEEILGTSDQQPGQSFEIRTKPVMPPGDRDQFVQVEKTPSHGDWEFWKVVDDFADSKGGDKDSKGGDKHCMLDLREGKVLFGPRVGDKQFGAIPKSGVRIRVPRYRVGGGEKGNLPEGTKLSLLTTIPKLSPTVKTRTPLAGGQDAETLEAAKLQAPKQVRDLYRKRAVTRADFEELVAKMPGVGAVYCVQQGDLGAPTAPKSVKTELELPGDEQTRTQFEAGKVKLLVTPVHPDLVTPVHPDLDLIDPKKQAYTQEFLKRRDQFRDATELVRELRKTELAWPPDLGDYIWKQLDPKRLLTATLDIEPPIYVLLSVLITISTRPRFDPKSVTLDLAVALYQYFHPLHGGALHVGEDGGGWAFNERRVTIDQIYNFASQVRGVDHVSDAHLRYYEKSSADGKETWQLKGLNFLELPRRCVLYSGFHDVELASG